MRLSVLRLVDLDTIFAKEPSSPVIMALRPVPSLHDAQIARLATAAPWNPVMIEATIGRWDRDAFHAEILSVESAPKINPPKPKRRVPPQSLLKQWRGYIAHD
jgi:hypothetical protein